MSINNLQQTEKAYKKIVFGKAYSKLGKPYYIEDDSISYINAENVYLDLNKIPSTKPISYIDGQSFDQNAELTTTDQLITYKEDIMSVIIGSEDSLKIQNLVSGILPFNFMNGLYRPLFFDQNGDSIPTGLASFEFDHNSGIITFMDGRPSHITSITIKFWYYSGKTLTDFTTENSKMTSKNFLLYDGATDVALNGEEFTINHNLDSEKVNVIMYENDKIVYPESITITDSNNIVLSLYPTPIQSDNVSVSIIPLQ